ncbi:hypothetical protein [Arenimonas sp.]|uniref:hypothetical protein n=1 Tax=Arenimonas sp. TaxID=1872635 RepID=UPI0035B0243A
MASVIVSKDHPRIAGLWDLLEARKDIPEMAALNVATPLDAGISAIGKLLWTAAQSEQDPIDTDTLGDIGCLLELLGEFSKMVRQAGDNAMYERMLAAEAKLAEFVEIPVHQPKKRRGRKAA